jgi:hypothetical protein
MDVNLALVLSWWDIATSAGPSFVGWIVAKRTFAVAEVGIEKQKN